mgnify:CR=1 FL=1
MTKPASTKDGGLVLITCRKASVLLSKQQDLPLGRAEALKLRFHLAVCKQCRNVARQFAGIRLAMRKLRDGD